MLRVGRLLKGTRRRSIGSTLVLLLALSAWQYFDEGRISWPYTLLDQFRSSAGGLAGNSRADEQEGDPRSLPDGTVLTGRAVEVKDGDTFILRTGTRTRYSVRLHGIDAPEWDQPHGKTALRALSRLINGREVTVQVADVDDYGRLVGRIRYQGEDINLALVADGHAWWYKQYAKSDQALATAEDNARDTGLGLWADADPVPPWLWRRRR